MKKLILLFFAILFYGKNLMAMEIFSSAFKQGDSIPKRYTCDGDNISPPLNWQNLPPTTQSLVLIMDDPDAPSGLWTHWVLYNIPLVNSLPENTATLQNMLVGKNSWGKQTYGGPCPPSGQHRYFFKLYALNSVLPLKTGALVSEIEAAMQGHIIAHATLMGIYQRKI